MVEDPDDNRLDPKLVPAMSDLAVYDRVRISGYEGEDASEWEDREGTITEFLTPKLTRTPYLVRLEDGREGHFSSDELEKLPTWTESLEINRRLAGLVLAAFDKSHDGLTYRTLMELAVEHKVNLDMLKAFGVSGE